MFPWVLWAIQMVKPKEGVMRTPIYGQLVKSAGDNLTYVWQLKWGQSCGNWVPHLWHLMLSPGRWCQNWLKLWDIQLVFAGNYRKLRKNPTPGGPKYKIEKYYSFNRKTELSFTHKVLVVVALFHFLGTEKCYSVSMYNFNFKLSCLSMKWFRVAYKKQKN